MRRIALRIVAKAGVNGPGRNVAVHARGVDLMSCTCEPQRVQARQITCNVIAFSTARVRSRVPSFSRIADT